MKTGKAVLSLALALGLALSSTALAAPPDMTGGGAPGGGGGGSESSASVSYSGATTLSSDTTESGKTYSSGTAEENALLVSGGTITLENPAVTKSGSPSGSSDNYDFYGTNAAVLVYNGATLNVTGGSVTTEASYASGVFAYGTGTANVSGTAITTSKNNSGGIMVTGGGTLTATDLTVNTAGGSSAAIRSDRGGGTLTVSGGSYTTSGSGSPVIYSTADITVKDGAVLTSNHSEGVVVEGGNSVTLEGVTLEDTNDTLNGNSETYKNIFLYQSMSGDASSGGGSFTATGSRIVTHAGDTFFVTNNSATITLSNNTITNDSTDGYFLRAQSGKWGASGSNGGNVTLTLDNQDAEGDIYLDGISTLSMSLLNGSDYTGAINAANSAQSVALTLDAASTLMLTGDSYVTSLTNADGTNGNIYLNGYTLYVNGTAVSANGGAREAASDEAEAPAEVAVTVNGAAVEWTDAEPYIDESDRAMVPLRAVANALGLEVYWDEAAWEASFSDGAKTIYFPIGSNFARTSEGGTVEMDTAAVINVANDRSYAPARYLAEYFDYTVDWNEAARTVAITK